ncbi:MAG: FtsW/RodA/SpoVE family cell cycle protein [Bacteroidales bacterium]|nr:FtsW/RodA/SpoVE family cell cycle protein [Bacteroidales bacterium]HOL97729.1 FtsW/RodA/SpoVE family cell cycle protein [Bacteroidales bacterium]HOM36318.1 FtsW/RodA/SpoVE family cell cycle protein [Bacteroidales bacterium]HPD23602.1 FtsW/RodA/SpoVE family cell cycle protein [Bacteroidales bacterium]HRS99485.1 FtsW/RodA/SpoVE family cell cycle protein [Bacteroidales bacterium]
MEQKRQKIFEGDKGIWRIMLLLCFYSIISVYSASSQLAYDASGINASKYLFRQIIILAIGTSVALMISKVPYKYFSKPSVFLWYLSIFLLIVTLIWGLNINDARRWLLLPGGITFQTSDFAKIALLMFLSRNLTLKEEENKNTLKYLKNIFFPILITCGLITVANLSTGVLLFGVSMILVFLGKVGFKNLAITFLITIGLVLLLFAAIKTFKDVGRIETWNNRIETFRDPNKPENIQQTHSKIAVATGKLFGKGPGKSIQRNILPNPYSDYIFAIITEELGLVIGVIPIMMLYLFLFLRARRIIKKAGRKFGIYITASMSILIVTQALSNMAVATNVFPVTGQPLPFISYGGTSIFFTGVAFGIILSVSREVEQKELEEKMQAEALSAEDKNKTENPIEVINNAEPNTEPDAEKES